MNLQEIKKTTKENTPAIFTSIIIFLLVGFYLIVVVPANEQKNDNYHKSTLEEFDLQFNNTLKDYANQVDVENLKDSIVKKATELCWKCEDNAKDTSALQLLKQLQCRSNFILDNIQDNVIIQSVRIDSITNLSSEIIINKRINLKFSSSVLRKCKTRDSRMLSELCSLKDTSRVDKVELKKRLSGAIAFKNWVIYSADKKEVLLSQTIDNQEFDSIKSTTSKLGVLLFKFSDKRFYRQSVAVEGTSNNFMLVGGINQANFDLQSKSVNLNYTFVSAFFVILLLLSIPLIKPLISNKKEKVTQFDLLSTTSAIGILAIVFVSFSFSQYLSNTYENIAGTNLMKLNTFVSSRINSEFNPYYNSFNIVNPGLQSQTDSVIHYDLDKLGLSSVGESFINKIDTNNFQNFFAFNSQGDLVKDISKKGVFGIRRNFSERDYFQVLKEKSYNNMLTTVFSKYDNQFKFVYIKKNYLTKKILFSNDEQLRTDSLRIDTVDFSLSGFAYRPQFMDDFILNINTGYMLCNNTGRVLLNSDIKKSLHEDIYANSQKSYNLSKMLNGMKDSVFELNYNGEPCLFFARRFTSNVLDTSKKIDKNNSNCNAVINDYPLYLLTYKKLGFTNNLKIYTIINGFILSLAYVLAITFLVLLYSFFFYLGEISILSRYHLYWLFPDNSRRKEYVLLKWINYSTFLLFLILFIAGYEHFFYHALLSGINLAFLNFLFLNQRVFLLRKTSSDEDATVSKKNAYLFQWALCIVVLGYIVPYILYRLHFPSFGLSLSLLSHFIILYFLKKDTQKNAVPEKKEICEESNRPIFISYFISIISFHYILVPILIIFTLFITEVNIVAGLNSSYTEKSGSILNSTSKSKQDILKTDGKVISLLPVDPPSKKFLEQIRFDNFKRNSNDIQLLDLIRMNPSLILLLMLSLFATIVIIGKLIGYYSGRFFFFELSEAYRLGYFKGEERIRSLTNFTVIIPPYSEKDLENLELTEKINDDIPEFIDLMKKEGGDSKVWLKGVPSDVVSNQVKVDLIMMNHFEIYSSRYKELWDELSKDEQFVMSDFALDSFVNYKSRNVLLSLMQKGYIIADPLTGRLRVMNYGFRNFIIHLQENDPESAEAIKIEEANTQGGYSKWKLPLMIIAISGILMFMYINKESFNNALFIGGSAISAIGLIAKFLNAYKQ